MRPWRSCARSLVRLADARHNTRETEVSPYALSEDSSSRPHAPAADSGRRHPIRRADAHQRRILLEVQRQRLEPRHGLAGSGLQRRELAGGAGAAWLRGRRRINGPVLRNKPLQPAHHVLLQARLHRRGSGGHRGPDAPLRAGRRVHHLSQRRGSRPFQHARRHRDLYDAGDGINRRRRRERVASGPPRSGAAGHGDQRHRRGDPPAITFEQRHQLRSRAAGHGGSGRSPKRQPHRSREPEPVQRLRVDVQRLGVGPGRARQRNLICTRRPPDCRVQRSAPGGGCADHGGHAGRGRREWRGDQHRRADTTCARPDEIPGAGRGRQRAGAGGGRHHVGDAPVDLHRLRQRDAGLPAHAELDRGSGNLERARARIGVGVPGRRRRGFERRCGAGRGLHDHRSASRRRDPVRSGLERRRAQLRNRAHRVRHRRRRFHQQRVGQFSRAERGLQEQPAGDRDQTACRTEHHGHLLHGAADRSDLLLERSSHGRGRPAEPGTVRLRADRRRQRAGPARAAFTG